MEGEERKRKESVSSVSSVGSSAGNLDSYWGKKRKEREREDETEEEGKMTGFKKSVKTMRSPEDRKKRGGGGAGKNMRWER